MALFEAVHHCHSMANKNILAEQLCGLVCAGLQQDPDQRPSMDEMRVRLWNAWKTAVEMNPAATPRRRSGILKLDNVPAMGTCNGLVSHDESHDDDLMPQANGVSGAIDVSMNPIHNKKTAEETLSI